MIKNFITKQKKIYIRNIQNIVHIEVDYLLKLIKKRSQKKGVKGLLFLCLKIEIVCFTELDRDKEQSVGIFNPLVAG